MSKNLLNFVFNVGKIMLLSEEYNVCSIRADELKNFDNILPK